MEEALDLSFDRLLLMMMMIQSCFLPLPVDMAKHVRGLEFSTHRIPAFFLSPLYSLQDVHITDSPLLLRYQPGGPSELTSQFYVHQNLEDTPYEVLNKTELWAQFVHLRLQTRLPLTCELQADAISEALLLLQKKVGGSNVYWTVHHCNS